MERKSFPLSWPDGWKRTKTRIPAGFGKKKQVWDQTSGRQRYAGYKCLSVAEAVQRVLAELKRMGIKDEDIIISTNVPLRLDGMPRSDSEPADPGVAVYWQKGKQAMRCMAVDQYYRVADNIAAIAATLDAMRAIERHGGAQILERAFLGFAALPETTSQPWRETLGIGSAVPTLQQVEDRFRTLAQVHHPDKGGDRGEFEKIVAAREAARLELSA